MDGTHIRWPNGAQARVFGASTYEEADKLRGLNHSLLWCDEIAAWKQLEYVWQMAMMGLRLNVSKEGEWPRVIATTTPRKLKFLKELVNTSTTRLAMHASTKDAIHLPERQRQWLLEMYGGTRLGEQELEGKLLDDVDGAFWNSTMIDDNRTKNIEELKDKTPAEIKNMMRRIVIGVDPATTANSPTDRTKRESDDTGIVIARYRFKWTLLYF